MRILRFEVTMHRVQTGRGDGEDRGMDCRTDSLHRGACACGPFYAFGQRWPTPSDAASGAAPSIPEGTFVLKIMATLSVTGNTLGGSWCLRR